MPDSARSKTSIHRLEMLPSTTMGPSTDSSDTKSALWTEIVRNRRIAYYCLGLITTALLTGFDTVVIGTITALPFFQKDFGEVFEGSYIVPSLWLALWSAVAPIGQMTGAITGGWVQDQFGRRKSIMLGSFISAASIAVCYISDMPDDIDTRRGVLLVGKTVLGFALGIMLATTQTYMSEVTPPTIRGPILGLVPTGILLGQLTGAIVIWSRSSDESANSYLISIASQWPFSAVPFFVAFILPESPTWFVRRGLNDAALHSLQKLYKDEDEAHKALDQLVALVQAESTTQQGTVTYLDCFKGTNCRRTGIVIFASLIPIIFGLPLLAQASYFIQIVGMEAGLSLVVLILGIALGFIGNGIGLWVMSKIGRRPLVLTSFGISTVLWLGMGIAGIWSGTFTIWYSAATMMLVIIVNGVGSWPSSYAVGGEVSSLRLRARSQGIGWFTNSLGNGAMSLALPYIFNPDSGNLKAKLGFVMSAFCLVGFAISWLMVPEMRHRSNVDIDQMFNARLPTRKFRTWAANGFAGEEHGSLPGR